MWLQITDVTLSQDRQLKGSDSVKLKQNKAFTPRSFVLQEHHGL